MVVDVELHQLNLGHFSTWPPRIAQRIREEEMGYSPCNRHTLHRANQEAPAGVNNDSRALAETSDASADFSSELNHLLTAHIEISAGLTAGVDSSIPLPRDDATLATVATANSSALQQSSQISTTAADTLFRDPSSTQDFPPSIACVSTSIKRRRAHHDVDGPGTGHLSCKKRRLRLQLITSRLSQPFSLPATHILNRESDEDTPVMSRFVKLAALGAKRAGHQTTLVRKAAILNRVRLSVRQAAITRGHDRIWRMTRMGAMSHGLQLVTDSTGAMFPGRSGEQVPGPIVPRAWRPHTTGANASPSEGLTSPQTQMVDSGLTIQGTTADTALGSASDQGIPQIITPPTSIMTPLAGADEDEASFPGSDLDARYADGSDEEMDDVYADFGVLFGGGGGSPEASEEEHYYEEYLDEVDGIIWAS